MDGNRNDECQRGEKCLRDRFSLNNAAVTEKPFTSSPGNFHTHFSQPMLGEEPVS